MPSDKAKQAAHFAGQNGVAAPRPPWPERRLSTDSRLPELSEARLMPLAAETDRNMLLTHEWFCARLRDRCSHHRAARKAPSQVPASPEPPAFLKIIRLHRSTANEASHPSNQKNGVCIDKKLQSSPRRIPARVRAFDHSATRHHSGRQLPPSQRQRPPHTRSRPTKFGPPLRRRGLQRSVSPIVPSISVCPDPPSAGPTSVTPPS